MGIARRGTCNDTTSSDDCVGIEIINPHAGDVITFTSNPRSQVLEYAFELTGARTIDDVSASVQSEFQESDVEVGASGSLTWPCSPSEEDGSGWMPFVSMTHGALDSPSTIRVVEM